MHKSVLKGNLGNMKKQRNAFIAISALALIANTFLGLKIATSDQQIVLVPALRQEMMISKAGVSKSYLEEMSLLFLSNLLDLSPNDIGHKKEIVMKYTVSNDKKAIDHLMEYFSKAAREYKTFGLSTFFSVKNLEIELDNLTVVAHGILTSYYGKQGHESEDEDYKLEFEYQGGNLRLKSFTRIIDDKKAARDKAKNEKFEKEVRETLDPQGKDLKAKEVLPKTAIKQEMSEDGLPE